MAKDTTGTRMTEKAKALRKQPTRAINIRFPIPLIRRVEQIVETSEDKTPAEWIREVVLQRLERES